ncbi:RusA family crossover junction endodeoxyribonuclease [Methanobrevibacter sp.]|uniref:RusA family crossover junction endodeoxyribonuclease n=1 Tax=Methanobrevibacter sp. TaxID=66852 RepID=UPI00388D46DC
MKFTIHGRLSSLNEYTLSCRANMYGANSLKKKNQKLIFEAIREAKLKPITNYPVTLKITWYEPNKRRDIDNITFATKFIQDALVEMGMLEDDSQKYINGLEHQVLVDKENPRIEVKIKEV